MMCITRYLKLLLLVALMLPTPLVQAQPPTRPQPAHTYAAEGVMVELYQDAIPQGRAGLMRVSAAGITAAEIDAFQQQTALFAANGDTAIYGFLVPKLDQPVRTHDVTVTVTLESGERRAVLVPVTVRQGGFIRQDVILPPDRLELIEPEVELNELALLDALTAPVTPARYWGAGGFVMPVASELTSPFGAVRTFNAGYETRHTGWDFEGGMGDIMTAMADGRVAYAGNMDIRGGYVLLDHGYGVYSGYAHMSVMHVVQGQFVRQGQILGLAGSTGRSSDPHLHVEMRVNGRWVDLVDFTQMWLP
jgi:murein DD-endopeptidase MepM/ murein hydrolase activator NlpD